MPVRRVLVLARIRGSFPQLALADLVDQEKYEDIGSEGHNVEVTIWNEFAAFANKIGLTKDMLAATGGLAVLLLLFICRRPILQAVKFIITAILTLALFGAIFGGGLWVYQRFGALPAGCFAVGAALFIFLAVRGGRGGGSRGSSDDEYLDQVEQEESRRRDHEHQLREAERIQRNHYG